MSRQSQVIYARVPKFRGVGGENAATVRGTSPTLASPEVNVAFQRNFNRTIPAVPLFAVNFTCADGLGMMEKGQLLSLREEAPLGVDHHDMT